MSTRYTPLSLGETPYGAAPRTMIVHRIRRAEASDDGSGCRRIWATWMCGSLSTNAVFIADPDEYGGVCERCNAADSNSSAWVYRCYSADEHLLYIGSTISWQSRAAMHQQESPWWPEVARVDKAPQPNLGIARRAEIEAIRDEAPIHNRQHNVKRFRRDGYAYVPVGEQAALGVDISEITSADDDESEAA